MIARPKSYSVLVKPSSHHCNMACSYCFYKHMKEDLDLKKPRDFMDYELSESLVKNTLRDLGPGDFIEYAFQGGEPTILGLDFYKDFLDLVEAYKPAGLRVAYSFQTNGLIIDQTWCEFFLENSILLGLSIDGPKSINDRFRLDMVGRPSYERLISTKSLLDAYSIQYNILSVLSKDLASSPDLVWDFLLGEKIGYIQFIPFLSYDGMAPGIGLGPRDFAFFYKRIFALWFDYILDGSYISIGLFEELINGLSGLNYMSCSLRGTCSAQYVIESDGRVYPCDFYVGKDYFCGNIKDMGLEDIKKTPTMEKFLKKPKIEKYCQTCPYVSLCNGGCKRLKDVIYLDETRTYCGLRDFLDYAMEDLLKIVSVL